MNDIKTTSEGLLGSEYPYADRFGMLNMTKSEVKEVEEYVMESDINMEDVYYFADELI